MENASQLKNLPPQHTDDPVGVTKLRLIRAKKAHAQRVIACLKLWKAPDVAVAAAAAAPRIERRPDLSPQGVDAEAVTLAKRLVEWRMSFANSKAGMTASTTEWLSLVLGRLYRLAYLDVPSFPFTLLLLADHEVRMSAGGDVRDDIALHTHKVFAPLAEMLGVWNLHKQWVERSYSKLFEVQYSEMRDLLCDPEEYTEKSFRRLHRERREMSSTSGSKTKEGSRGKQYLLDKAEAFLRLKPALLSRLRRMNVRAQVVPISHHAGLALRRVHEGESIEDVASRLSVRIICPTVAACYTALGVVHSLGSPVSVGSTLHFKDQIASPQPNGYRALHATITFRNFKKGGGGAIVVECRIVTHTMHRLNQGGVIAGRRLSKRDELPPSAWWHRLDELDRQLSKIGPAGGCDTIKQYLIRHEPRSASDPLYVFTPRGEIVLLPSDSTALDFAYSIHTQMGHHAMRIEVNGNSVPHGYPLRNGDIVRVHHHPNFAGPDISWLGQVKTSWARTSIRRGLTWRANSAHPGRAYFEAALLKALNWYEREKGYKLSLSSARVSDFLLEKSRAGGYADVREFYPKLNGNNELTRRLVEELISAEIATTVVNARGRPLTAVYEPHQIRVCMMCRPAPREPIVGVEHLSPRHIKIHLDGRRHVEESGRVPLGWAEQIVSDPLNQLVFRLSGEDRPGLLREVLDVVYRTPKTYLLKVDARTDCDGHAEVALLVRGEWLGGFDKVLERLGKVSGVQEIKTSPPSPAERLAPYAAPAHLAVMAPTPNPYTSEEVYHRGIFFNRQELLSEILWWLRDERTPRQTMILHGQRRVGKTSLVKHLISEYLPQYRFIYPVFVDLQGLDAYTSVDIASFIVRKVYEGDKEGAPPREQDELAWAWARRALKKALERHHRLLIAIDEFNFLIDAERKRRLDPQVYDHLRFLINDLPDINWMLVVQDTHFLDADLWLGAGVIFQKSRTLPVRHLEKDWAKLLIVEPSRKCGITLRHEARLLNRVMRLTAGNPLLIHLICYELVKESLLVKRRYVDEKELEEAVKKVLHHGQRWFDHFKKNLTGKREVVMAAVTEALRERKSAPEAEVIRAVGECAPEIKEEATHKSLAALAMEGQVAFKSWSPDGARRVYIPIEMYRRFITRDLNLHDAVDKWRATRRAHARTE
jgi:guanosine-3',5'-bis(diphosphate) 3'-pyrophosphohydrolase